MIYRIKLRKYDQEIVGHILRFSSERYFDTITTRKIVVGRHVDKLILIPYDESDNTLHPVTIHATTRKQINFRLKTGRFINE